MSAPAVTFAILAQHASTAAGHPTTFLFALGVVLAWGASGPIFHYSDTWQLVINTGTTVITFLMVFLIQAAQNRDAAAVAVKLDVIIAALDRAPNVAVAIEARPPEEIDALRDEVRRQIRGET